VSRKVPGGPFQLGTNTYPSLENIVQSAKSLPATVFIRKPVDSPSMFSVVLAAQKH